MIKIAILLNSYHNSGPSNVMKSVLKYVSSDECRLMLITLLKKNSSNEINHLKKSGIDVIQLDYDSKNEALFKAPRALKKIVTTQGIHIIHSNSLITDLISITSGTKARHMCTLHNNMFYNYYGQYGKIFSKIMIHLHLLVLQQMDLCVCCSNYIRKDIAKYTTKITTIRNGVDAQVEERLHKSDIQLPIDSFVYIFAGVLNARKQALWLAEAFSKVHYNDEYLLILGEGEDKKRIQQIKDNNIRVYGFINKPASFFLISNVYISASLSEGFPLSVLESISVGTYLLLSDIPTHREIIKLCEPHYVGDVFTLGDLDSLRAAMNSIRNKGRGDNQSIKSVARKNFSALKMASRYKLVYHKLLNE